MSQGHQYCDPQVELALRNIIDTFSGGNNINFVAFLAVLRDMDAKAAQGDMPAIKILKIITDFSRLIDVFVKATKMDL
jgi:hypothetical protein